MELRTDVAIVGGGLGGVAAALAAAEAGCTVVLTEQTCWLGGQLTSQMVPLDDHIRVESDGANASYRLLRNGLRDRYRRLFPLTESQRHNPHLNPGEAWVSPVSVDPRAAVAVLDDMLAPYVASGRVTVLHETTPMAVAVDADRVSGVSVRARSGEHIDLRAAYYLDATELGEVLALGQVEHVSGRESRDQTGEPGAAETADPTDMQGASWCFAIDHLAGEDHTIDRPADYAQWRDLRPAKLGGHPILSWRIPTEDGAPERAFRFTPNQDDDQIDLDHHNTGSHPELWNYRRIAARRHFTPGYLRSDVVVVNWPLNDYIGGPLFGVPDAQRHWAAAKALSRSLLYWLQTEAPRPDGGTGWPGVRLRRDVAGTVDGFAMHPYIRESRRIRARRTIVEQDLSTALRRKPRQYIDSVGVGHYFWIDRHLTTGDVRDDTGPVGIPHPFEIPLGALIPERVRNLLPAAKNIGTTQITNGCYRLHPVEWSIGEAAGALTAHCLARNTEPHAVADDLERTVEFQSTLIKRGVQLRWGPFVE